MDLPSLAGVLLHKGHEHADETAGTLPVELLALGAVALAASTIVLYWLLYGR